MYTQIYPDNYYPQQYAQYGYQGIPPDIVQQLTSYVAVSEHQKAELRYQLQKQIQAERAYQEIIELNGTTCVLDKYGRPLELASCTFTHTVLVEPQPPLRGEIFFLIWTNTSDIPLKMTKDDFFRDAKFLFGLQPHPGVAVKVVGSQKDTAARLRLAIAGKLDIFHQVAYAGWRKYEDGYRFHLFSNFRTHLYGGEILPLVSRVDQSPDFSAIAATSAKQLWPAFRLIADRSIRQMVVLTFYTSQLHTLMREMGFEMPMTPYFFSSDRDVLVYLKRLFCWYGDSTISTNTACKDFNKKLLYRRDQPLLLEDDGYTERSMENIRTLENTLADHHVPWKSGRDEVSLPLQALPVIISGQVSSLCCAPETLVIDISAEHFDRARWEEMFDAVANHAEHRDCFARYTEAHLDELRAALTDGRKLAVRMSHGQLNERCLHALGTLLGMRIYLQQFFRFCAPAAPPLSLDEKVDKQILNLMKQATEKEAMTSLPEQFVYIARQHIQKGLVKLYSRERAPVNAEEVVYADIDRLHFTAPVFFSICRALHQSRPVILRALDDEGLLCGARTNHGTAQTRIVVYNAHGVGIKLAVYSIDRSRIEELGDPFTIQEVW